MAENVVSDELWEAFHKVVDTTSRELREWLAVSSAGADRRCAAGPGRH